MENNGKRGACPKFSGLLSKIGRERVIFGAVGYFWYRTTREIYLKTVSLITSGNISGSSASSAQFTLCYSDSNTGNSSPERLTTDN
ncbi:hypothetical protein [Thermoflavimicrobium dichotomicum]|uniref:hypothetical protein n=1 Tax=Thermoflavimicrobium dichotomicum TaxID=46223 RepID=UPI00111469A4|nr:hypothetical protein [Thermoflavimicrobium dichotomicum]